MSLDLLFHFKGANLSSFLKSTVVTCAEKLEGEMDISGPWWGQAGLGAPGGLGGLLATRMTASHRGLSVGDRSAARPCAPARGPSRAGQVQALSG